MGIDVYRKMLKAGVEQEDGSIDAERKELHR